MTAPRPTSREQASTLQVLVGTLVSLVAMLTVQLSVLTAWVDTFGSPGGLRGTRVDQLGRPLTGWSQLWHELGPLLWGVYALVLMAGVFLMWRAVFTRPPRATWRLVPVVVALSAVFWILELHRF